MTESDFVFAQECVRALNMVAASAKKWLRAKAEERAPHIPQDTEHKHDIRNGNSAL